MYKNRYFDEKEFSIGVFSNDYNSRNVNKIDLHKNVSISKVFLLKNFDTKFYFTSLSLQKYGCKAVSIGSDIYVSGYFKDDSTLSVVKNGCSTKTWYKLPFLNK